MTLGTVLVIEDNPITRKVVRVALAAEGYQVLEAENGASAMELIEREAPDLVLQDIGLSDVDGFELVGQLRHALGSAAPPVVAFTGLTDEAGIRAAGFDDLLVKPVSPSRLLRAVRVHVEAHQTHRPAAATEPVYSHPPPRDRLWRALPAMLGRLTELAGTASDEAAVVSGVLTAFLDASGFFAGAAFVTGGTDRLCLRAQFGFTQRSAAGVSTFWDDPELLAALAVRGKPLGLSLSNASRREQRLLQRAGVQSLMLVPLMLQGHALGVLVLGSANRELPSDWIELAEVVAGPIAQTVVLARTVARVTASEHKFRGIAECTADAIVVADDRDVITYVNASAERLLGVSSGSVLGRSLDSVVPVAIRGAKRAEIVRPDGETVPVEVSTRGFEDPPGHRNRVYVLRDLSEHVQVSTLTQLANHDGLTGLVNRRRFEEELAARLADCRRYGTTGALMVVDLDRFKDVNDTFGHQAGDAVLQAVAEVLRSNTRESDLPARLGGDEFVVLLNHTGIDGAHACADKITDRIASLAVPWQGNVLSIGASIGVAAFPDAGHAPHEVFAAADEALYSAKFGRRTQAPEPARKEPKSGAVRAAHRIGGSDERAADSGY